MRVFTALFLMTMTPALAGASAVPVPSPRPDIDRSLVTGSVTRAAISPRENAVLKAGLEALGKKDVAAARTIRDTMTRGTLDHHILTWAIALSGLEGIPSSDIASAQTELKGWPGLNALRALSERALARENAAPADIIAAFGGTAPETTEGSIALTRAFLAVGDRRSAAAIARPVWREKRLDKAEEAIFTREFASLLTKADHKNRMDRLMYRDRIDEAKVASELAGAQSLYKAWAAVIRNPRAADKAIAGVHPSWHTDPAYLYVRIRQLRSVERDAEAARLLASMPKDRAALVDADEWWVEARIISRDLFERGKPKEAYRLAAAHHAESPAEIAEAEFHAGWYALRGLKDARTAARHFARILEVADGQISTARAHYWLGRAAEAGSGSDAVNHYTKAAALPATFYGQLASAKLNRKSLSIAYPSPSDSERQRFAAREAVRAIAKLEAAGFEWRAASLYRALAGELTSPGEIALLAAMAERRGDHRLSLQIGKIAWNRGLDVAALAFPLGAVPGNANIAGSGKALAYSIARQESAFDKAAVSPAGARGLLQLLPGTAKEVAGRHGLPYSKARLTSDAGYNATLGAHFLGEQIDALDGSYVLTFAAYNAGPSRIPDWISRFGDPRGKSLDAVIDWIEMIPFTETRSYVQRVMENYQIYKARLGQPADIERDLRFGRRR